MAIEQRVVTPLYVTIFHPLRGAASRARCVNITGSERDMAQDALVLEKNILKSGIKKVSVAHNKITIVNIISSHTRWCRHWEMGEDSLLQVTKM